MNNNPCQCETNTFYRRQEKNGILTIAPRQGMQANHVFFLNATAGKIFDMCDGNCSLEQIAQVLHQQYPRQNLNIIREDVKNTLYPLKQLGVIKWQPYKEKEKTMIDKQNGKQPVTMQVIGEENVTELSNFIKSFAKEYPENKKNKICFLQVPFDIDTLYAPFLVRVRHFHFMEVFYIMKKGEKIEGAMSLLNLNPARKVVEIGVTMGTSKKGGNNISVLMDYVVGEMKKLGLTKIKYLIPFSSTDLNFPKIIDESFEKFMRDNKFSLEATLTNEIREGIDLIIWSRHIN